MATVINCTNKYDNVYNYNIEHNIEDINGFEINVLVRVNGWFEHTTLDTPENSDFKIDYDSFEIDLKHHSETEKETINNWVDIHKEKGTFEDAFGKSYHEIE